MTDKMKKATQKSDKAVKRQERAEAKKARKLAKENRHVLYSPEKMQAFKFSEALGYFLRFFAIAFSVFGVCVLICDSFLLSEVNPLILLAYCVGAVSAFSLIFIGGLRALLGFGMIGAYVGLFFAFFGNLLAFYVSGSELLINRVMDRLEQGGFAALDSVSLPYFGGIDESLKVYGGIFAVATVLSLIFAAFSARRTRLIPMVIFGGGLCAVCFTYNLCTTNWGICCVLAGLCSAIVLSAHDKVYKKHKKSKKSRAYSGYSAAIAGLLALVMLLVPGLTVSKEFMEIEAISDEMEYARTILTTILTGGNPKYNKMNTLNKESSAKLEDIEPTGAHLFTVGAGSSKRNIYLRGWVGDSFNVKKDSWSVMDEEAYKKMLIKLEGEPNGFTGDYVTALLYQLADPESTDFDYANSSFYSNPEYGFVSTYIDVQYVKNTGLIYVLPSAYNSMLGLLEFESRTEDYNQSYSIVSDGIAKSSWFNLKKSYTAMSMSPSYINADYAESAEKMALYYQLLTNFITGELDLISGGAEEAVNAFAKKLEENSLDSKLGVKTLRAYLEMDRKARYNWQRKNIQLVRSYTEFVKNYYTSVEATKGLSQIYSELEPLIAEQTTDHGKLMCVIDYLVKNYEYTLTPTKPQGEHSGDLDAFLLETKNGYCVQFATAATLLFRMMGYPARYVQGYVASDFNSPEYYMNEEEKKEYEAELLENEGRDEKDKKYYAPYISKVSDEDAHAWVEVYIDGLGWRTYEPTPVYYTNLYEVKDNVADVLDKFEQENNPEPDQSQTTTTTPPVTSEPVTKPEEEESEPIVTFDMKVLIKTLVIILVISALLALIIWHTRRVNRIVQARASFVERAIYGTFEEKEDMNRVSSVLCDSIYEVHYIIGNRPRLGEDPSTFAERVDKPKLENASKSELQRYRRAQLRSASMKDITVLIEKHEFGNALSREELSVLGQYLSELTNDEYQKLGFFKKLWYRYFKFMI